jgi:polyribonucleotide 5'-hydroxyl-kinase
MADPDLKPIESKEWTLEAETEYRFELDPGTTLAIKVRFKTVLPHYNHLHASISTTTFQLVHGEAEVFGAELAEGKPYLFGSECKAAIFTWQGCTIEMSRFRDFVLAYSYHCPRKITSQVIPPPNTSPMRHQ